MGGLEQGAVTSEIITTDSSFVRTEVEGRAKEWTDNPLEPPKYGFAKDIRITKQYPYLISDDVSFEDENAQAEIFVTVKGNEKPLPLIIERDSFDDDYGPEGYGWRLENAFIIDPVGKQRINVIEFFEESGKRPTLKLVEDTKFYKREKKGEDSYTFAPYTLQRE